MKPFGKEKLVLGERRKKATHQDKTKNRPINLISRAGTALTQQNEKMKKRYFWKP